MNWTQATPDSKIASFERDTLRPALAEICASKALGRDFVATISDPQVASAPEPSSSIWSRWSAQSGSASHDGGPTADSATMIENLDRAARAGRRTGPSLILVDRKRKAEWPAFAGVWVMTPFYAIAGNEVHVSPGVAFWMAFNENTHAFNHRYDNAVARHRVEDVTRQHVLNHVLNSTSFYKMYAASPAPFPGYR